MSEAVIAGYIRSPFHFVTKGALARTRPDDLAAGVERAILQGGDREPIGNLTYG